MTNGYPNIYPDALVLDDDQYSQGSEDPYAFYGGDIFCASPEFLEQPYPGGPTWPQPGIRPAWLKINPTAEENLKVQIGAPGGGNVIFATLFEMISGNWYPLVDITDPVPEAVLEANLEAGHFYYITMRYLDESAAQYNGAYHWYAETGPTRIYAIKPPPVKLHFSLPLGDDPPPATPGPETITPDPITLAVSILEPSLWAGRIDLTAPADQDTIVTATPQFMVAVTPDDDDTDYDYTVEVQYAATADFASPVTLTDRTTVGDGGAVLQATNPVPATTYWRARVIPDGQPASAWSATSTFTVDATTSATTINVTWNVVANAARPIHFWHFSPVDPDVGDVVTIYGQGFPTTGHLTFGTTPVTVATWNRVPATAENEIPTSRRIQGDEVTAEHYEVTFLAPNIKLDVGDVLTVGK